MLPILAVVIVSGFLFLHFTGLLDDVGRRAAGRALKSPPALKASGPASGDKEMDRRLKVFESFIENLTRPGEEADDEPGDVRKDNSPKD